MTRVDEEVTHDLTGNDQSALLKKIFEILEAEKLNAIIFQDYNKGILTPRVITEVINKAKLAGIPVAVDPKKKNFLAYQRVELFKPNLKELREGLGLPLDGSKQDGLKEAAIKLHREQGISTVMITLSENGVFISRFSNDGAVIQQHIPAHIRNISDVSGAGDTVISVAALGIACRLEPGEIASLSNLAGGIVCEVVGVVPVNRDKLLGEAISML
jgi:rfaE bifunctional protein kinase chain/domain